MRRRIAAVTVTLSLFLPAGVALAAPDDAGVRGAAVAPPPGMPTGLPPAAYLPEPELPAAAGWPFSEAFPRTSGTGRLDAGALLWSDWLYDDHGAAGLPGKVPVANLAFPTGTYAYPEGPAHGNGADIFRAGVGHDGEATYWRVDWTTLADAAVPIAAWAWDTGRDVGLPLGATAWPADSGVRSEGVDTALIVSAAGAWLVDLADDTRTPVADLGGTLTLDERARSFTVRLPLDAVPVEGTWRVQLAAGLASDDGEGFAQVTPELGSLPGQPNVYNVTFRSHEQEDVADSEWLEGAQALALATGDVSAFGLDVPWARLLAGDTEPEPIVTGWSNRWYVSSIELGDGVQPNDLGEIQNLEPAFLGRVQPYGAYVPTTYRPDAPAPLTWILHSLQAQHNQYGNRNPTFLQQACEQRGSVCATPLGRGPDGWYYDEAELDVMEVWNRLAAAFTLDPEATITAGYSMGGYGSYRLALSYPQAYAGVVALAAPPGCCSGPDRDTTALVASARWLPTYVGHGALDELVPVTGVLDHVAAYQEAGYRYRFDLLPAEGHLPWSRKDDFRRAAEFMGERTRAQDPGHVSLAWYPSHAREDLGLGAVGGWWVGDVVARDGTAGEVARIEAVSRAIPDGEVEVVSEDGVAVSDTGSPILVEDQRWELGATPALQDLLEVTVTGVQALRLDLVGAGLTSGERGEVQVDADGPTQVTLAGLAPGTRVTRDGSVATVADGRGEATVMGTEGPARFVIEPVRGGRSAAAATGPVGPAGEDAGAATAAGPLPVSGGLSVGLGALLLAAAAASRRGPGQRRRTDG